MSVPIPISYDFPGAETPWGGVPASSPSSGELGNAAEADDLAREISIDVAEIREQAELLAEEASQFIDACKDFTANIPPSQYVQPDYVPAVMNTLDAAQVPAAPTVPNITTATPALSSYDVPAFVGSDTPGAPPEFTLEFPDEPDDLVPGDVPAPPQLAEISIPTAPEIDINLGSLPTVAALPGAPAVPTAPDIVEPQTLGTIDIPAADFAAQIARLQAIAGTEVQYKEYQNVVPDVFAALGGVVSSYQAPARQQYMDLSDTLQREVGQFLRRGFQVRGFDTSRLDATYHEMSSLADENARRSADAADVLWRDDARKVVFELASAAHSQAMDISKLVLDLEFSALTEYAEAQLALVAAVSAAYEGAIAALEGEAANKAFVYAAEESRGLEYQLYIETLKASGQQNRLSHRVFQITEDAKKSYVKSAKAEVTAEEAKLKAFEAENDAVRAAAEGLDAKLTAYRGRIAAWAGQLAASGAKWAKYSSQMDAVSAQNRAIASSVELGSIQNKVTVSEAQARAANLESELAQFVLGAANRRAALVSAQTTNTVAADKSSLSAIQYGRYTAEAGIEPTVNRPELDGLSSGYRAASRFFEVSTNAAGRAAEMTQGANEQLARAYATAQESAGRALASLEAGKFSRLRASVAVSASGRLGASGGISYDKSNSHSWSVREGWTATKSYNVTNSPE